jgi:hypothetical protein
MRAHLGVSFASHTLFLAPLRPFCLGREPNARVGIDEILDIKYFCKQPKHFGQFSHGTLAQRTPRKVYANYIQGIKLNLLIF